MSDNFIPLNQSTPVQNRWQQDKNQQQRFHNNRQQNGSRRPGHRNKWGNNSRSSYGSNSSNNSYGQDNKSNIDLYIQPSMLQDPWASLRDKNQTNNKNSSST